MPYILTPTGWRVLSEEENDEKTSGPMTPKKAAEIGEEPTNEANTNLNESQMELLEALCDAGYLSEEQLVEGVRSFLAGKLKDSAAGHEAGAQRADRQAELIRKALKAGRGGALLGPNGTDAQAERELRRKEKEGERRGKAAGRRTALARLIDPPHRKVAGEASGESRQSIPRTPRPRTPIGPRGSRLYF